MIKRKKKREKEVNKDSLVDHDQEIKIINLKGRKRVKLLKMMIRASVIVTKARTLKILILNFSLMKKMRISKLPTNQPNSMKDTKTTEVKV